MEAQSEVLAFGDGHLPRSADAEISVRDAVSREKFSVSAKGVVLEETFTMGWWRGNEVAIRARTGGLRVFGSEWTSTKPQPVSISVDSQTGNFTADVDGDEVFHDLQWTTDRFLTDTDGEYVIGVSLVRQGSSRSATVPLRSSDPIPSPEGLRFQLRDGSDRGAQSDESLVWTRGVGTVHDVPVDVWFEDPAGWSWITFSARRIAGVSVQGIIGTVDDVRAGLMYAAWVPTETVAVTGAIERRWSTRVPMYLPQGVYGSIDGTVYSVHSSSDPGEVELRTYGPYAPRSRDFRYAGSFGRETSPTSAVEGCVEVRTTASLAGHHVELRGPASQFASAARVAVVGQGTAPDDLVLADGHQPMIVLNQDGSWGVSVGRFHLDDIQSEYL
ncbi:hypothetical protein ACPEEZ_01535 [Frigoribacterium sp. 2-23]|uniref:hypothetical protein n=1 Tax=Frigoribacterium sp. 2-23 TaxID=3415006 RepID=UPI003C6F42D6